MTIAEPGPLPVEGEWSPATGGPRGPDAPTILDTTELRWFVAGPLPTAIHGWFNASIGVAEDRWDSYQLDHPCDIGVKRRFRETVELKVRQSLDGHLQLGEGLTGSLEGWRKWSPAARLVDSSSHGRWVDVYKSIVKRRFTADGTEIAFSSHVPTGAGCDVETAEVRFGAVRAWTLAFAAFGPPAMRRGAVLASWQGLGAETPWLSWFDLGADRSMGYPEWLALVERSRSAEI